MSVDRGLLDDGWLGGGGEADDHEEWQVESPPAVNALTAQSQAQMGKPAQTTVNGHGGTHHVAHSHSMHLADPSSVSSAVSHAVSSGGAPHHSHSQSVPNSSNAAGAKGRVVRFHHVPMLKPSQPIGSTSANVVQPLPSSSPQSSPPSSSSSSPTTASSPDAQGSLSTLSRARSEEHKEEELYDAKQELLSNSFELSPEDFLHPDSGVDSLINPHHHYQQHHHLHANAPLGAVSEEDEFGLSPPKVQSSPNHSTSTQPTAQSPESDFFYSPQPSYSSEGGSSHASEYQTLQQQLEQHHGLSLEDEAAAEEERERRRLQDQDALMRMAEAQVNGAELFRSDDPSLSPPGISTTRPPQSQSSSSSNMFTPPQSKLASRRGRSTSSSSPTTPITSPRGGRHTSSSPSPSRTPTAAKRDRSLSKERRRNTYTGAGAAGGGIAAAFGLSSPLGSLSEASSPSASPDSASHRLRGTSTLLAPTASTKAKEFSSPQPTPSTSHRRAMTTNLNSSFRAGGVVQQRPATVSTQRVKPFFSSQHRSSASTHSAGEIDEMFFENAKLKRREEENQKQLAELKETLLSTQTELAVKNKALLQKISEAESAQADLLALSQKVSFLQIDASVVGEWNEDGSDSSSSTGGLGPSSSSHLAALASSLNSFLPPLPPSLDFPPEDAIISLSAPQVSAFAAQALETRALQAENHAAKLVALEDLDRAKRLLQSYRAESELLLSLKKDPRNAAVLAKAEKDELEQLTKGTINAGQTVKHPTAATEEAAYFSSAKSVQKKREQLQQLHSDLFHTRQELSAKQNAFRLLNLRMEYFRERINTVDPNSLVQFDVQSSPRGLSALLSPSASPRSAAFDSQATAPQVTLQDALQTTLFQSDALSGQIQLIQAKLHAGESEVRLFESEFRVLQSKHHRTYTLKSHSKLIETQNKLVKDETELAAEMSLCLRRVQAHEFRHQELHLRLCQTLLTLRNHDLSQKNEERSEIDRRVQEKETEIVVIKRNYEEKLLHARALANNASSIHTTSGDPWSPAPTKFSAHVTARLDTLLAEVFQRKQGVLLELQTKAVANHDRVEGQLRHSIHEKDAQIHRLENLNEKLALLVEQTRVGQQAVVGELRTHSDRQASLSADLTSAHRTVEQLQVEKQSLEEQLKYAKREERNDRIKNLIEGNMNATMSMASTAPMPPASLMQTSSAYAPSSSAAASSSSVAFGNAVGLQPISSPSDSAMTLSALQTPASSPNAYQSALVGGGSSSTVPFQLQTPMTSRTATQYSALVPTPVNPLSSAVTNPVPMHSVQHSQMQQQQQQQFGQSQFGLSASQMQTQPLSSPAQPYAQQSSMLSGLSNAFQVPSQSPQHHLQQQQVPLQSPSSSPAYAQGMQQFNQSSGPAFRTPTIHPMPSSSSSALAGGGGLIPAPAFSPLLAQSSYPVASAPPVPASSPTISREDKLLGFTVAQGQNLMKDKSTRALSPPKAAKSHAADAEKLAHMAKLEEKIAMLRSQKNQMASEVGLPQEVEAPKEKLAVEQQQKEKEKSMSSSENEKKGSNKKKPAVPTTARRIARSPSPDRSPSAAPAATAPTRKPAIPVQIHHRPSSTNATSASAVSKEPSSKSAVPTKKAPTPTGSKAAAAAAAASSAVNVSWEQATPSFEPPSFFNGGQPRNSAASKKPSSTAVLVAAANSAPVSHPELPPLSTFDTESILGDPTAPGEFTVFQPPPMMTPAQMVIAQAKQQAQAARLKENQRNLQAFNESANQLNASFSSQPQSSSFATPQQPQVSHPLIQPAFQPLIPANVQQTAHQFVQNALGGSGHNRAIVHPQPQFQTPQQQPQPQLQSQQVPQQQYTPPVSSQYQPTYQPPARHPDVPLMMQQHQPQQPQLHHHQQPQLNLQAMKQQAALQQQSQAQQNYQSLLVNPHQSDLLLSAQQFQQQQLLQAQQQQQQQQQQVHMSDHPLQVPSSSSNQAPPHTGRATPNISHLYDRPSRGLLEILPFPENLNSREITELRAREAALLQVKKEQTNIIRASRELQQLQPPPPNVHHPSRR